MKRGLLIGVGTLGGLGAVFAITPPQFGASTGAGGIGGALSNSGTTSAAPAQTQSAAPLKLNQLQPQLQPRQLQVKLLLLQRKLRLKPPPQRLLQIRQLLQAQRLKRQIHPHQQQHQPRRHLLEFLEHLLARLIKLDLVQCKSR